MHSNAIRVESVSRQIFCSFDCGGSRVPPLPLEKIASYRSMHSNTDIALFYCGTPVSRFVALRIGD